MIFDVEEKLRRKREVLRAKLKELGFALLQKSVWVSPYNIEEDLNSFLKSQNLEKGVLFLTVSKILVEDQQELVEKLWALSDLNKNYCNLLDEWGVISATHKDKPNSLRQKSASWEQKFLEILLQDPHLPKELLPSGVWYAKEVRQVYQQKVKPILMDTFSLRPQ